MDLGREKGQGIAEVAKARKELIRGGRASAKCSWLAMAAGTQKKGSKPLPEIRCCDAMCY